MQSSINDDVQNLRTAEAESAVGRPGRSDADASALHLRRGGTSVVIDLSGSGAPVLAHWGEDLGSPTPQVLLDLCIAQRPQRVSGGLDETARLSVAATPAEGWLGTPLLECARDGVALSTAFDLETVEATPSSARIGLSDAQSDLQLIVEFELGPSGLLQQRLSLTNTAKDPCSPIRTLSAFPVPWEAIELFDTTGHHLRERSAQRRDFTFGTYLREGRRGRPGADAPLLLAAGEPGFGFRSGLVHGIHVGWSGNQAVLAERVTTGESFLAGGELLSTGEISLGQGQTYTTPWTYGSWGHGLDELSARFHAHWRERPQHPRRPRPVTLNTWEAVYFDHSLPKLLELADAASDVGVERFVLDDGWFAGRRDDTAGLGDWYVDLGVWPDGLHPLTDRVTALGMEFGLWVEPEMVNPDSELAREHPDWLLRSREELPVSARQQQVLDLSRPDAYAHVLQQLNALLDEYPIAYLKWDHNRDLLEAGTGTRGRPRVHAHTEAVYRLIDELKHCHPGLEIESCASGGARVDLGILDRTDRVWTSDSLDPLERLDNQRHTALVVPPEMMGMHLSSPRVHSSARSLDLRLMGAVALFGHFGIEWDLTSASADQRADVGEWVALARRLRPLVATGRLVNADLADAGLDVRGMVSEHGDHAVFTLTQSQSLPALPPAAVRLPGLDQDRVYRVTDITPGGVEEAPAQSDLSWRGRNTALSGRMLGAVGLRPPVQYPQQSTVLELTAIDEDELIRAQGGVA